MKKIKHLNFRGYTEEDQNLRFGSGGCGGGVWCLGVGVDMFGVRGLELRCLVFGFGVEGFGVYGCGVEGFGV